jgi:asparagine synthase (glutamine-hydrolysing)
MCGIAGVVTGRDTSIPGAVIADFTRILRHRGPDGSGFAWFTESGSRVEETFSGPDPFHGTVLAHRRLAILDLSEGGSQPMSTPDGMLWIAFNGEIYNYIELRQELIREGYVFRSESDTEVLLAGYWAWGRDVLRKVVGMFAFAVLDRREGVLFLARDEFGIKPLYYTRVDGVFAFASEIKALLGIPGLSRRPHRERLLEYLRFGLTDHGNATMFADVAQLPAAHWIEVKLDTLTLNGPTRYWDLSNALTFTEPIEAAVKRCRELFLESISLHMRSDVPVGAALSGGIDSSAIVCAMRTLGGSRLDLHAFSFIGQGAANEEMWVDDVQRATQCTVHKIRPQPADFVEDFRHLVRTHDEPFGGVNIYAQYRVFRAAQESGIKVMLDGQGADELFAGYRYFIATRLSSLLYDGQFREAAQLYRNALRLPDIKAVPLLARTLDRLLPAHLRMALRPSSDRSQYPGWIAKNGFAQGAGRSGLAHQFTGSDRMKAEQSETIKETSLPHLLHWEDRNSMSFSIESRVPFLTRPLANFACGLPEDYLLTDTAVSKAVLRRALKGIVPDSILGRKDKIGYGAAERDWLLSADSWVRKGLHAGKECAPVLNTSVLLSRWDRIRQGVQAYDSSFWRCLNLIEWSQQFEIDYRY